MLFEVAYAHDGTDYPISGPVPGETASSKYVRTGTPESTLEINGKPIGTTTEVMSEDLNMLTSTTIGRTESGTPIRNVHVYEHKWRPV